MKGTFSYLQETGDGEEKYNFKPFSKDGKKVCLGFVETGFTKGGYKNGRRRQMHIENIKNSGKPKEYLDNVLVVWCATLPESKKSVIVGWYKDATVYRTINTFYEDKNITENERIYNVVADKRSCIFLPKKERLKDEWVAYRKIRNPQKFGFGQSNVWYAREDVAEDYINKVVKQIKDYEGVNWI